MSTSSAPERGDERHPGVHLVLAVKNLQDAKGRLSAVFPGEERAELVLAMLHDTLEAATAAPMVSGWSVVTPDSRVARLAETLGGRYIAEPTSGSARSAIDGLGTVSTADRLNNALTAADDDIRGIHSGDVIALQADLPALATDELVAAYDAAAPNLRSVVVDHTGHGTSALIVRGRPRDLEPRFGPDSANRHLDSGAVALTGTWPGLRLDVDTPSDIRSALALGVGRHTRKFLDEHRWRIPMTQ